MKKRFVIGVLSEKEIEALRILKQHSEMTSATAQYLCIHKEMHKFSEIGLAKRFILYTEELYDKKEQGRIGFHGGSGHADREELRYMVCTFRITLKGHSALRKC